MRTYFHLDTSKNFNIKAGYFLENKEHDILFEAKVVRLPFFKPGVTEFIDHRNKRSVTRTVGNTMECREEDRSLRERSFLDAQRHCHFDIDGINCWEFLSSSGFSVERQIKGLQCHYTVYRDGTAIGTLQTTSRKGLFDDSDTPKKGLLSGLPCNGNYKVDCEEQDLEDVFMVCYCLAKANV